VLASPGSTQPELISWVGRKQLGFPKLVVTEIALVAKNSREVVSENRKGAALHTDLSVQQQKLALQISLWEYY